VFHTNMSGVLDRISGDLRVFFAQREASGLRTQTWQMKCRPAQGCFRSPWATLLGVAKHNSEMVSEVFRIRDDDSSVSWDFDLHETARSVSACHRQSRSSSHRIIPSGRK
jgi:hypothetical protein